MTSSNQDITVDKIITFINLEISHARKLESFLNTTHMVKLHDEYNI